MMIPIRISVYLRKFSASVEVLKYESTKNRTRNALNNRSIDTHILTESTLNSCHVSESLSSLKDTCSQISKSQK